MRQQHRKAKACLALKPQAFDQDYVFYHKPAEMHIPNAKQLENWYIRMLEQARPLEPAGVTTLNSIALIHPE